MVVVLIAIVVLAFVVVVIISVVAILVVFRNFEMVSKSTRVVFQWCFIVVSNKVSTKIYGMVHSEPVKIKSHEDKWK